MARVISRNVDAVVKMIVSTFKSDDSVLTREIRPGDLATSIRYVENEEVKSLTGNVEDFTVKSLKYKGKYDWKSEDDFAKRIKVDNIRFDTSSEYNSQFTDVNPMEIVEDEGVEDVVKVIATPALDVTLSLNYSDESTKTFALVPNTYLRGFTYNVKPGDKDITGTYRLITWVTVLDKNITTSVKVTGLVLQDGVNVITVNLHDIVSIASVSNCINDAAGLQEALEDTDVDFAAVSDITYEENIRLTRSFTLYGANVGAKANTGRRAVNGQLDGETVISGGVKILDGAEDVIFDGITFTGSALIEIGKAAHVVFKNCRFVDIVATKEKTMGVITNEYADKSPLKLEVTNCFFGDPVVEERKSLYNIFELVGFVADDSYIKESYFTKAAFKCNAIGIYNIENEATVTIAKNTFEYSSPAIRVGTMYDEKGTVIIDNNTYLETSDFEEGKFAGLLVIQPFVDKTENMNRLTITMNGNRHRDKYKLGFRYFSEGDTPLTDDNSPNIFVNKNKATFPIVEG